MRRFADPLRRRHENIGTALLIELPPDRAAADTFWNNEPFSKNGGYRDNPRIVRWVFGD